METPAQEPSPEGISSMDGVDTRNAPGWRGFSGISSTDGVDTRNAPGWRGFSGISATEYDCPVWFFLLTAILLMQRPLVDLSVFPSWNIPGNFEEIVFATLFFTILIKTSSASFALAFAVWGGISFLLGCSYPVGETLKYLIFISIIEAIAPSISPWIWCVFWSAIPAFSWKIIGEPLPATLLTGISIASIMCAYYVIRRRNPLRTTPRYLLQVFSGLALGAFISSLLSSATPVSRQDLPKIVFDEAHFSSESALGKTPMPNGHQEMAAILTDCGFSVSFLENSLAGNIPSGSILISVLPARRYADEDKQAIVSHVAQGGGFLAILDHTDMDGASSRLSPVLTQFGITPAFDTISWPGCKGLAAGFSRALSTDGFPGTGGSLVKPAFWIPSFMNETGPHPLAWIDASAKPSAGTPASPMNRQMSSPEKSISTTGPTWIGSWGKFGEGRWTVFTDSSWFQNGQVRQNIRFMNATISLLKNGVPRRSLPYLIFGTMLCFMCLYKMMRVNGKPLFPLGIIAGALLISHISEVSARNEQPMLMQPTACILELPDSTYHMTAQMSESFSFNLDVLADGLGRAGYLPSRFRPGTDSIVKHDLWILPPSDSQIPDDLSTIIKNQVTDGAGLLILGSHNFAGSRYNLEYFGFQLETSHQRQFIFDENPYGLPDKAKEGPFSLSPTPHELLGSWSQPLWCDWPVPVYGGEALFTRSDGCPVVSSKILGKGRIIAVGDEIFFSNKALEIHGVLEDKDKKAFIEYFFHRLAKRISP